MKKYKGIIDNYYFVTGRHFYATSVAATLYRQTQHRVEGEYEGEYISTSNLARKFEKDGDEFIETMNSFYRLGRMNKDYRAMLSADKAGYPVVTDWFIEKDGNLFGFDTECNIIRGEIIAQDPTGNYLDIIGSEARPIKIFLCWPDATTSIDLKWDLEKIKRAKAKRKLAIKKVSIEEAFGRYARMRFSF